MADRRVWLLATRLLRHDDLIDRWSERRASLPGEARFFMVSNEDHEKTYQQEAT
jgi:hypothetical protein